MTTKKNLTNSIFFHMLVLGVISALFVYDISYLYITPSFASKYHLYWLFYELKLHEVTFIIHAVVLLYISIIFWRNLSILREIKYFSSQVKKMSDSKKIEPIMSDSITTEVSGLQEHFNGLANQLNQSLKSLKQFSGNLAHEIRTPLQIMQFNAEKGMSECPDASLFEEQITQVKKIEDIISGLLFLAKAENAQHALSIQTHDLNSIVLKVLSDFQTQIDEKELTINMCLKQSVDLDLRMGYLAIANVIQNAIRYTPENGIISIFDGASSERIVLTIADTGIGMSPAVLSQAFDRLARANKARDDAGLGLGLSIANAAMYSCRATIDLLSCEGFGTCARLIFSK